jgi:serine/threonine-protein kinase
MSGRDSEFDRGRRVGKYEILTRLSIGGMAELFLAFLPGPGGFRKFFALKQILPDVRADESFVKMFLDEARITAAFNHPNIAQVFDLGEDPDSRELYLAMEFIAGQNLEQTIKRAAKREVAIPVGFACRVVHDTCLALHYAHTFTDASGLKMPVVHRDVSPKNVMVTYGGQVKVIDYGIAKARGRLNRTQIGVIKGTSGYMSPEQVRNERLDGRTDLFAAATMLHELLSGERLFVGVNDAAMMIKIVEGEAPPLDGVNPGVSTALSDAVLKGLEKARDARFATGREFARALQQACPDMFDDEQVAEFMGQLFDDKIALTRSLLELANEGRDVASISRAVEGLTTDDPSDAGAAPKRKTGGAPVRSSATPSPRQAPRSSSSSQRLRRVSSDSRPGQSSRALPRAGGSSRELPRVGGSKQQLKAVPPRPAEDDEATPPPTRKPGTPPAPSARAAEPADAGGGTNPGAAPARRGGGAIVAAVVLVALLGAGGWLARSGRWREGLARLEASDATPPVDTGPAPIDVTAGADDTDKPQWLRERQQQRAELEAEKARQAEAEAAANDPERKRVLEELQAQLQQLDTLEAEQRELKLASREGQAASATNSRRISDLQRQIDDLKALVQQRQARPGAAPRGAPSKPGEVEVVTDARGAKAAAVGYVTLRTVNPSSAAVHLEDDTALGSTPLVKVPLDVGVHRLRVVDGDGRVRLLSVTVEAGKTVDLKGVDVGSLPPVP